MASIKKFVESVTVTGNQGITPFLQVGNLINIFVMPPEGATYDFGIMDESGFIVYSKLEQKTFLIEQGRTVIYPGEKKIIFQRASDGIYRVKLIFEE